MSLKLTTGGSEGGEFELVPEGLYVARCYRVLDLGTQTIEWQGNKKEQHKVMISWELLDDDTKMADGRPYAVHKNYTLSLHEKAALRADLEAWRNKKFSTTEVEEFDLDKVAGAYCQIQVVHSPDGKYANVQSIVSYKPPVVDGKKFYPKPVNELVVFDIDHPRMAVFNTLSENMQKKIMAAPEWQEPKQTAIEETEIVHEVDDPFAGHPEDILSQEWAEREGTPAKPDTVIEPTEDELQGRIDLPDVEEKPKARKEHR